MPVEVSNTKLLEKSQASNAAYRENSQLSSTLSMLVKQDPEDLGGQDVAGEEEETEEKDEDILDHSSSHNEVRL
jgi:hypothetical protein